MSNPRVRLVILLMLTWLSTWYVTDKLIIPNVDERIVFANLTLAGQNEPPYRYRLFEPATNNLIQVVLLPNIKNPEVQHIASYFLFSLITFALLYNLLYRYLMLFFTSKTALVGLLLFQIVLPLTVTGYYMEGDFVTLVIYLIALNLIFTKHDRWLPPVIALGAFVREQTIFILVLYLIYHYTNDTLARKTLIITGISGLIFAAIYLGLRIALSLAPTIYTSTLHLTINLNLDELFRHVIPLWFAEIIGFVILSLMAYKKSNRFFRLALISLIAYVVLFFFNGLLNELGKFLPAHLILIPMSLQVLMGEYIGGQTQLKT